MKDVSMDVSMWHGTTRRAGKMMKTQSRCSEVMAKPGRKDTVASRCQQGNYGFKWGSTFKACFGQSHEGKGVPFEN